ncbi:MAG: hypothetical protein JWO19_1739 [Bryobacterales bacterium]|nr:hypothetical protein [Bryobacterales bacterium]
MNPAFLELKRRTQENLMTFLRIEADLASTFCDMVEVTQSSEHRVQLLEDIRKAVSAIRQFERRITDTRTRAQLNGEADRLDDFLKKKG